MVTPDAGTTASPFVWIEHRWVLPLCSWSNRCVRCGQPAAEHMGFVERLQVRWRRWVQRWTC